MNEYIHILHGSKANDSDLGWILNLRINSGSQTAKGSRKESMATLPVPPNVFFKNTQVSSKKKINLDKFKYDGNHADVRHLILIP